MTDDDDFLAPQERPRLAESLIVALAVLLAGLLLVFVGVSVLAACGALR